MNTTLEFLLRHGYAVLFVWVLAEQAGLPFPVLPLLLAAGSLSAQGKMNLSGVVLLSVAACLIADVAWFMTGRTQGARVLRWMCRISLEPDSCVSRTKDIYARHGEHSLLLAKFVPGLSAVLAPLSGVAGMRLRRYLMFDGAGSFIWTGTYVLLGYMLSHQLTMVARYALRLGESLMVLLVGGLAGYVLVKFTQRRRFLKRLRMARIGPEELKMLMDSGEDVLVVDLRQPIDLENDPEKIPGSVRLDPGDIAAHTELIPPDREIVLYCTCPNEATSAGVAMLLRRHGIDRVRPLEGGIEGWRALNFPMEPVEMGD